MITDAEGRIVRVNKAFTRITGYTSEQAVGQTAGLLRSDRHDSAFHADIWDRLRRDGMWQGEIWNRRRSGEVYPQWLAITAVPDEDPQVLRYVGTMRDISDRKLHEAEFEQLAFYDALTGLPNRRLMKDRLHHAMAVSARTGNSGALMFIDLDRFKAINDAHGHAAGDHLLQQVAHRLTACLREGDTVARLGGDEFVVILAADLSRLPDEATDRRPRSPTRSWPPCSAPTSWPLGAQRCSGSVGLALFSDHSCSVDELLKRADQAMYEAKRAGRNALRVFDPELHARALPRLTTEAELRRAIVDGGDEFVLHYQAVVDARSRWIGAEALVRWRHPLRGLLAPDAFIPLAEETGLIHALGIRVLEAACAQLNAWSRDSATAAWTLTVNVSPTQLRAPGWVEQVLEVLQRSGAPTGLLQLELTETVMLDSVEDCVAKMNQLKARGLSFSLNDFGTRYASLTYVKRLPLDQLKIGRSFVRDVLTNPHDAAIAQTVIHLGRSLGLARGRRGRRDDSSARPSGRTWLPGLPGLSVRGA